MKIALTNILTPLTATALLVGALFGALLGAPAAWAGNQALMENWAKNKQQIQQKVFDQLQKEGKIPQNGSVYFEARTKKDPANPKNVLVEVDSIRVEESGEKTTWKKSQAAEQGPGYVRNGSVDTPKPQTVAPDKPKQSAPSPIKPVDVTGYVRLGSLDIPVGEVVTDSMRIRHGKIAPDALPPASGKDKPQSGSKEVP